MPAEEAVEIRGSDDTVFKCFYQGFTQSVSGAGTRGEDMRRRTPGCFDLILHSARIAVISGGP